MRSPTLRLLILLSAPAWALLLSPGPVAAEGQAAVVNVLGEVPFLGRVTGLSAEALTIHPAGKDEPRTIPLAELVEVRFPVAETDTTPATHRVTLMGGEVLRGTISGQDEDGFAFTVAGAGTVRVTYEALQTLEALPEMQSPCHDLSRYPAAADADIVYLKQSGERYLGTLATANDKQLSMEDARDRIRKIAWSDVRVMHLANDPIAPAKGLRGEIELIDGTRIAAATPPTLSKGSMRASLASQPDAHLEVPMRRVRALRYSGAKFVFASDLPFEGVYTSIYETTTKMLEEFMRGYNVVTADRDADGCPLRTGGATYRHGFAVRSRSDIKITIGGSYASLQALVGIDDSVREKTGAPEDADIDARVLGDGKVLWEAKGITLEGGPKKVGPIKLEGVKELVLVVDFGKNNQSCDHAVWVNPILVKK